MYNNRQLLRALRKEVGFFESGGYGRPFRSGWRSTLLFRDSPTCTDSTSAGSLTPCAACPLFALIPRNKRQDAIPCHHIVLDAECNTIAKLYREGSQKRLDLIFRLWLTRLIDGLERQKSA